MARDPYAVLGVAKTASAKDIKSAYRRLAKKFHPDQNPDDPKARDRFAEISQAYDIVGDEKRRAQFDAGEIDAQGNARFAGFGEGGPDPFADFMRAGGGPGGARFEFRTADPRAGGFGNAGDIFSQIFGQAFRAQPQGAQPGAGPSARGADVDTTVTVTLEEAASAAKVNAILPGGRTLAIKLPDHVEDGQIIRLKGQGMAGPTGQPGDALVKVAFKRHPRFRAEGRDLHLDLPVQLRDAVFGAKLPVDTLSGRLAVTVPAWSGSDKVLRLKGRGLPARGGGAGDLLVHVRVMLPEGGDAALEAFLKAHA